MSEISLFFEQFHWLRPLWLLALVPAAILALLIWRQAHSAGNWHALIAPELLNYLVDGEHARRRRWGVWALLFAWMLAAVSLAGPTWEQRPMPVHGQQDAMVIVLDLSPSMLVEDVSPSRLARARLKIADMLQRAEGLTGLVAYAGSAHVVTPLTDDVNTIRNLVPALHPDMMPLPGSNAEEALAKAIELLNRGAANGGRVIFVTDGIAESAQADLFRQLDESNVQLSILGIGTPEGAPIPNERGGFTRDSQGNIVIPRLDEDQLRQVARHGGGRYHTMTRSDDDVEWLLSQASPALAEYRQLEREFDTWYDRGHWLVLLMLPVILYAFRPGVLLALVFLPVLIAAPQTSQAQGLEALWFNPDQRGERLLERGEPDQAAREFKNPEWRGTAHYRAGEYEAAAEAFAQSDTPRAHYNRGNALARAGQLEAALDAYDQALSHAPDMQDAIANRELVEQLLQQQEQQDSDESQNDGDSQNQDQQDQDQPQDGDQQDSQEQEGQQGSQGDDTQQDQQDGPDQQPPEQDEDAEGQEQDDTDQPEAEAEQQAPDTPEDEQTEEERQADLAQEDTLSDEEKQALEQWLRRVPDNPSGLLRRKFQYQAEQQQRERLRRQADPQNREERW
ncbi:VWA domain-containing protein [Marinimicrobium sp. ABcell2]|uniref:VWA domain-containing protein n=1 Tax=Marinimicrobium sp. ABcell2 TaxID=3069751 RepID=UPI0027B46C44|nr:VWA domain-containing protein [Marinimicrobium sp. ABcell2]MDQ2075618.1 VWA domain-containing protein [Marinimicrobium sp. ABcell2]